MLKHAQKEGSVSQSSLEERVMTLERQVADLQSVLAKVGSLQDWRSTLGMFSGDEVMKRIDAAALKFREDDRRRARKRQARSPESHRV